MNNPRFSIITITFNSEKTVERTLKSVLNQTFKDYEYIIVDGASKDGTMDIVRKYEPLFEGRMKWKSESDKGIYDAMNKGILRSNGTLVGIVNSDDWLEPDALENVNKTFEENGCSTNRIYTGGIRFHSDKGWKKDAMPDLKRFYSGTKYYIMAGIRHPATFVPKEVYNKIGVFNSSMYILADTDLIVWAYYSGVEFIDIQKVLSNMADGGASNGKIEFRLSPKSLYDKKTMLSRYKLSRIEYIKVMSYWKLKHYVRTFSKWARFYKVR